jgi:hypothetical protein
MPYNASYARFIFGKVFHMYYKLICILYALLCGHNFILVESGCYSMRRCTCKKHKLNAKGPPIGSLLLFICGTAHVKSISWMLRDRQSGAPSFLYAALHM